MTQLTTHLTRERLIVATRFVTMASVALVLIVAQSQAARAQWTSGTNINNTNSGSVSVGTTNPGGDKLITAGNTLVGNITGHTALYSTYDSQSNVIMELGYGTATSSDLPLASLVLSKNLTGTNNVIGAIQFANRNIADGSEKRLASIANFTDGALNSGLLSFNTTSAGTLAERMRITSAGNVGLGTASPGYALDVQQNTTNNSSGTVLRLKGNSSGTNDNTQIRFAGKTHGDLFTLGTDITPNNGSRVFQLYDLVSSAARFTVDPSGNVGIGTSNPYAKFVVTGGADTSLAIGDRTTSGSIGLQFMGTGYKHAGLRFDGDNLILENASVSTTPSTWYSANPMNFIVRNGSVGIGTTSPGYKLDVQGGALNSSGGLCIAGDCKTGWLQVSTQWTTAGSNIHYPSGNVGMGVTAPVLKLDIGGLGSAVGFSPGNASSLGPNAVLNRIVARSNYGAVDTTSAAEIKFLTGNAVWYKGQIAFYTNDYDSTQGGNTLERMRITSPGNVGIGTSNPSEKLEVSGNIKVTGTGNIDASGTLTAGNIVAKYQDVAEWVESSQQLSAGTVVVLDQAKSNQVIASSQAYDTRVAGVISAQPGITLGEKGDTKVLVATTGRVKVKVDASAGPIRVGDLLVTSDIEGVAKKSEPLSLGDVQIHRPGTLIGKALEPLAKGTGEILVLLSLQ